MEVDGPKPVKQRRRSGKLGLFFLFLLMGVFESVMGV